MFLSSDKPLVLPYKVMQRFADLSKTIDIYTIEVNEPYKISYLSNILRYGLYPNHIDLWGFHSNFSWRDEIAKKNCLMFVKLTLFSVNRVVVYMEYVQYLFHMFLAFFESVRADKDVIKITHGRLLEKQAYGVVDSRLEYYGYICQPE
jgi:hypothetical protein